MMIEVFWGGSVGSAPPGVRAATDAEPATEDSAGPVDAAAGAAAATPDGTYTVPARPARDPVPRAPSTERGLVAAIISDSISSILAAVSRAISLGSAVLAGTTGGPPGADSARDGACSAPRLRSPRPSFLPKRENITL